MWKFYVESQTVFFLICKMCSNNHLAVYCIRFKFSVRIEYWKCEAYTGAHFAGNVSQNAMHQYKY